MEPVQSTYLLLFRGILLEVLLLQALYAPDTVLERWMWLLFPAYACLSGAWFWAIRRGRLASAWDAWFFLVDIGFTSLVLYLTRGFSTDFYIAYFLVIMASCFLEELSYSFIVGGVASVVYGALAWPSEGVFDQPFYLLRTSLLVVTAFFSTYIAGMARRAQTAVGERYNQQLAWMHRLTVVGRALAGVLHEVKTPVSTIILSVDYIRGRLKQGDLEGAEAQLSIIEDEAERAAGILGDFLEYTKPADLSLKPLPLIAPLQRVMDAQAIRLEDRGISAVLTCAPDLAVPGSERHLIQVFTNLVMNAMAAMPLGGSLSVTALRAGANAEIVVRDTGEGIAPETLARLFEPFSSTRIEQGGHGLGLFIARWIVQKHAGTLTAYSEGRGKGAKIVVVLPLAPEM
jgi:signal transduction histidine kinase